MHITLARLLSLLVASAYAAFFYHHAGPAAACTALAEELVGLVVIWFAQGIGAFTGPTGSGYVANPTPAIFISIVGWLLLIGLPLLFHFPPSFLLR